jgi:SnoaL-like domain
MDSMNRTTFLYAGAAALAGAGLAPSLARAADPSKSWQQVRALVARFVDAQNAHNLDVTSALLWDSPDFEMQIPDSTVRGHAAAVDRFTALYQGMWRLSPDYGSLDIQIVDPDHAVVTVPVEYKTGETNGDPVTTQSVLAARVVYTAVGWRIASLAPNPPPVTTR